MGLFSKKIEKQIASYQHELIETHYREVDNMYRQIRGGGTTTATTFRR